MMSIVNFPLPDKPPLAYDGSLPPPSPDDVESEPRSISPTVLVGMVQTFEFVVIALIGIAIHAFWVYPTDGLSGIHLVAEVAVPGTALILFRAFKIYSVPAFRTHVHQLTRLASAWTMTFLVLIALSFFAKSQGLYSRVWIGSWYVAGLVVLLAWRVALASLVRHWADTGRLIRRAVIVGSGPSGEDLVHAINAEPHTDLRVLGVFDDRSNDRSLPNLAGVPKLGTVNDLVQFARLRRVDLILIALPLTAEMRVMELVRKLSVLPIDVRLAAHMNRLRFRPRTYSYIGNVPLLDIFDKPIGDWGLVIKALFDRVVGGLLLLIAAPLLAVVAVAIKLDSKGPVLFRQRRHGFNNQVIEVLKFRTLHHHFTDPDAKQIVVRDDPRVTRVGRFLRKTSIDELPQIINVLRGDLSLVGPRPHALNGAIAEKRWEEVVGEYYSRYRVKPGITGWAQVNGLRGGIDTPERLQWRIDYDLYYIENWSLLFDIYILFMTPLALLETDNAY